MVRRIIGVTVLTGFVWFTFSVKLGSKTFAEHIQAIYKTREAQDLKNGVRSVVRPAFDEAKERVLGEYVEAPTSVHRARPSSSSGSKQTNQALHPRANDKKKQGSPSNQVRGKASFQSEPVACSEETEKSKQGRNAKSTSALRDAEATLGKSQTPQVSSTVARRDAKSSEKGPGTKSRAQMKARAQVSTQTDTKVTRASSRSGNSSKKSEHPNRPNSESKRPEPG